jgi:hypothetical protein
MPLRALYNPKPPKWLLIGLPDLAGDHFAVSVFFNLRLASPSGFCQIYYQLIRNSHAKSTAVI